MTEGPGRGDDSLRIHNTIPATSPCAEARKCGLGCRKAVGSQALGQGEDSRQALGQGEDYIVVFVFVGDTP